MIKSRQTVIIWLVIPVALILAVTGCASKKYVRRQVQPVHQQVATLKKETNDKISYLHRKEERDISQANERIASTDERLNQTAQGTASREMDMAEFGSYVANALHYQLMGRADVMFAFDEATLTPAAKRKLDEIVSKAQSTPRTVVEVAGFADPRGSQDYNFALSRRRAEAVQRYLVMQNVPPRSIHIVGLGKDTPPPDFRPTNHLPANATRAERYQAARRVQVRLFGAGNITQGSTSSDRQQDSRQQ